MSTIHLSEVLPIFHRALREGEGRSDGQLLEDYIGRRSEAAFAALVGRHGPMVWGVCRRILGEDHDAEDAFQATFLVLVRKASSIASRELLANWLFGVARQTALKARATAAKRKVRERQVTEMPEPTTVCEALPMDAQLVLDEELARLPEHQRAVIVLCDLEGRTRKEVAAQLGCPEGTVASRLVRAREMLAKRLNRRGILSAGGLAAIAHSAADGSVPKSVLESTIELSNSVAGGAVAAGAVSARVTTLAEGVIKAMLISKLKTVVAVVLLLGCLATGATILADRAMAGDKAKKAYAGPLAGAPVKRDPDKEIVTLTAWGKEVGGLQAGLGFRAGEHRPYFHGETVTLVVRVRNVGKEAAKFPFVRIGEKEFRPDDATEGDLFNMVAAHNRRTGDKAQFVVVGRPPSPDGELPGELPPLPQEGKYYVRDGSVRDGDERVAPTPFGDYFRQALAPRLTVTAGGATVPQPLLHSEVYHTPREAALPPGAEIELYELKLTLRPVGGRGERIPLSLYGTGKLGVRYGRVIPAEVGAGLGEFGTGVLELDVNEGDKNPLKSDAPDLVGDWVVTVAVRGGKRDRSSEGAVWTFKPDGKWAMAVAVGERSETKESTYTIDAKKTPAWLDVVEGPKGTPIKAIYKVDGDTLTLCVGNRVGERPTALESPDGGQVTLLHLTRGGKGSDKKKEADGDAVIRADHIVLVESSPVLMLGENAKDPAKWSCLVQSDGAILLTGRALSGPNYGRVRVLGLTTKDAEKAIAKQLASYAKGEVAVKVTLASPKQKPVAGSTPEVTGTIDGKAVVFDNGKDTLLLGLVLATYGSAQFASEIPNEQWDAALKGDHVLITFDKPHALKSMVDDGKTYRVTHLLIATSSNTSKDVVLGYCDGKYLKFGKYEYAPLQLLREKYLPSRQSKE